MGSSTSAVKGSLAVVTVTRRIRAPGVFSRLRTAVLVAFDALAGSFPDFMPRRERAPFKNLRTPARSIDPAPSLRHLD